MALVRALASDPRVLVLDEPTTGLDVVAQDLVFVSHDLGVVARVADVVVVLDRGHVCEQGAVADVLAGAGHPKTRELLSASPSLRGELDARRAQRVVVADADH